MLKMKWKRTIEITNNMVTEVKKTTCHNKIEEFNSTNKETNQCLTTLLTLYPNPRSTFPHI